MDGQEAKKKSERRYHEWMLVIVQCRDWCNQGNMLDEWRANQSPLRNPQVLADLLGRGIVPVFMLFTVNPVNFPAGFELREDECIVDLVRMRSWQPTTAYCAENAYRLRYLYRPRTEES
eukprot:m.259211 g.259211  ORF g.259211 m.259211 type:complete len:119 (-) comp22252_c0_seq1:110-466(-)